MQTYRSGKLENNRRLVRKTIDRVFPPCFLLALVYNLNALIDSVLAGIFFSPLHIAAIGVVLPINLIFMSLLQIFVQGTYANYTAALGRGQRRKSRELLTVGLFYIGVFGALFAIGAIRFASPLVTLFGAKTQAIRELAIVYLRFTAPSYPFVAVTKIITLFLNIYGYQKDTLLANVVYMFCNIALSVGFLYMLPEIGFGALGLGTLFATIPTVLICCVAAGRHGLPMALAMRLAGLRYQRVREMLYCGISVSSNAIIDGMIGGLINHIVVSSALGTDGLALYSVVLCFWQLSHVSAEGMDYAIGPMVGVRYSCGDKSGLKQIVFEGLKRAMLYTVAWVLVIFALTPLLMRLYLGADASILNAGAIVSGGVAVTLAFAPCYSVIYVLAGFYDTTDSLRRSIVFSVIPDSIIMPAMVIALLPTFGYAGIWLALGGSTLVFLIVMLLTLGLREKRILPSGDNLLHLGEGRCAQYPAVDAVLRYSDEDISVLSSQIQKFLQEEKASSKISYLTALCVDELATDIVAHCKDGETDKKSDDSVIELKIISETDCFRIILVNTSKPYNPLDFEYSNEDFSKVGLMMVQRIAKKIDYNYLYKANMIMIQIGKEQDERKTE